MNPWRRLRLALLALLVIMAAGTIGYRLLGFGILDAAYQTVTTVTTVTTVAFREVKPLSTAGKVFTIIRDRRRGANPSTLDRASKCEL